jgi:hypothetical protein
MTTQHDPVTAGPLTARLYAVVTALVFLLFVTNMDLFLSVRGYLPISTLILFVGVSGALLMVTLICRDWPSLDRFWRLLEENRVVLGLFLLWVMGYAIAAGRTVLSGEDVDYVQIFPILQFVVLAVGLAVAATDADGHRTTQAARLAILLLSASIIYETAVPGVLGSATARTGGVALNANIPGFILPSLLALSLDFRRMRAVDAIMVLVTLVGVTATLSRMGIAFLALVIGTYLLFHFMSGTPQERRRKVAFSGIMAAVLALVGVGSLVVLSGLTGVDAEFQTRVAAILAGAEALDDPYRGPLMEHFLSVASENPWLGQGAGETLMNAVSRAPLQLGPHNMYVRAWIDAGMAGLAIYGAFVVAIISLGILRRSVACTLIGVLIALYGLFSHNVADNKAIFLLAGAVLGQSALRQIAWRG